MVDFHLAWKLGYPHPDHLKRVVTWQQMLEMRAFRLIESGEYKKRLQTNNPRLLRQQLGHLIKRPK